MSMPRPSPAEVVDQVRVVRLTAGLLRRPNRVTVVLNLCSARVSGTRRVAAVRVTSTHRGSSAPASRGLA